MIEILNCSYLIFFLLVFFRFKLSDTLLKKVLLIKNVSLLDKYSFNILLLSFIFLVFSFFKINQLMLISILFLISIISLTFKNRNFLLINLKKLFLSKKYFTIQSNLIEGKKGSFFNFKILFPKKYKVFSKNINCKNYINDLLKRDFLCCHEIQKRELV